MNPLNRYGLRPPEEYRVQAAASGQLVTIEAKQSASVEGLTFIHRAPTKVQGDDWKFSLCNKTTGNQNNKKIKLISSLNSKEKLITG